MFALLNPEYLLLSDNKHDMYIDDSIKRLWLGGCNAQVSIYFTFQSAITYLKLTIETVEQGLIYVQS